MSASSSARAVVSPHDVVARFLLDSGYHASLEAFLAETQTSEPSAGPASSEVPSLRSLVEEHNAEQLAQSLRALVVEKVDIAEDVLKLELPDEAVPQATVQTLGAIHSGNVLTVRSHTVPRRAFNTSTAEYETTQLTVLVTTAADKTLKLTSLATGEVEDILEPHQAAIICVAPHPTEPRLLLTGSMDGTAKILDVVKGEVLQTFKHAKFVVRVAFSPDGRWLATASYDRTIALYSLDPASVPAAPAAGAADDELAEDPLDLPCPLRWVLRRNFECSGNPEGLVFGPLDADEEAWLAYTERGDHQLKYIMLPEGGQEVGVDYEIRKFNLNPNGDAWVSFSILSLAIHPSNKFISLLTGDHASSSTSRIFLYPFLSAQRAATLWTGSESDAFSNPRQSWSPDGSAVCVTSDDGCVRVIDLRGRVRAQIRAHGEHPTTGVRNDRVRDVFVLPATEGEAGSGRLRVASCGFDGTVRICA